MEILFSSFFNGLVYGLLLFLLSSGLTLIFSMMGVLNFAHASFYMLGAYLAFQISQYIGFWPALFIAPVVVGLIGAAVEHYALRRVHAYGHVAELLFTFGLAFLIEEAVILIWGRVSQDYQIPEALDMPLFTAFGSDYPSYKVFMMAVSVSILFFLYFLLAKTRLGLIIQAALSHPNMVSALGHNVPRVFMIVFGVGTGLAGLAGVIGGNALVTEPGMAAALGPIVFVVVVVGGLGSLLGAFFASLLIGFVQTFAVAFDVSFSDLFSLFGWNVQYGDFMYDVWTKTLSEIAPLIPYLLLVLILVFRPRGLMGSREL